MSNNDFAEDLSGTLTVISSATANYSVWTPTLYAQIWQTQVNSVAAAVPEPSTWALMLGPLVVLSWMARRRADRSG